MKNIIVDDVKNIVLSEEEKKIPTGDESELEDKLLAQLNKQGIIYSGKNWDNSKLEENFFKQVEELNHRYQLQNPTSGIGLNSTPLSISEKNQLLSSLTKLSKEDKIALIQSDSPEFSLTRDDGSIVSILLFDKSNYNNNIYQCINQIYNETSQPGKDHAEYDVSILINGLPLIHIELKRYSCEDIKEAFNQICEYSKYSFDKGNKLYEFVNVFFISDGKNCKYFSSSFAKEDKYEFVCDWTDQKNKKFNNLFLMTKSLFSPEDIHALISFGCIFTVDKQILVLRPYQLAASALVLEQIEKAHNNYPYNNPKEAGGYIWHGTGSGKTNTSFKTAQLALSKSWIKNVLFVVDRLDLDGQTRANYNKILGQNNSLDDINSTAQLKAFLKDNKHRLNVVTIQKLAILCKQAIQTNDTELIDILKQDTVLFFDECHRSQADHAVVEIDSAYENKTGMHKTIINTFTKNYCFGFTGTPIFGAEGQKELDGMLKSTDQIFGKCLHIYNGFNGIKDKKTLDYEVTFHNIMTQKEFEDYEANEIDREKLLLNNERIEKNCKILLKDFNSLTERNNHNSFKGFAAIFATCSIKMCRKYYKELKKQNPILKIAMIYSAADDYKKTDNVDDKVELTEAMVDFYGEEKDVDFKQYQTDIATALKENKIDILLVVNMFLTGFDSVYINTFFCDKPLNNHNMIQAISRTNRIYNDTKTCGKLVFFHPENKKQFNTAIEKYLTDTDGSKYKIKIAKKSFEEIWKGCPKKDKFNPDGVNYLELKAKFLQTYPDPFNIELITKSEKQKYIDMFLTLKQLTKLIKGFAEFNTVEVQSKLIPEADFQAYFKEFKDTLRDIRNEIKKEDVSHLVKYEESVSDKKLGVSIDYLVQLSKELNEEKTSQKEVELKITKLALPLFEQSSVAKQLGSFLSSNPGKGGLDEFNKERLNSLKRDLNELCETLPIENKSQFINFINKSLFNQTVEESGDEVCKFLKLPSFKHVQERKAIKDQAFTKIRNLVNNYKDSKLSASESMLEDSVINMDKI